MLICNYVSNVMLISFKVSAIFNDTLSVICMLHNVFFVQFPSGLSIFCYGHLRHIHVVVSVHVCVCVCVCV